MKIFLGLALCLYGAQALADFPTIQIENFRGNYQDPEGSATANKFIVPSALDPEGQAENSISAVVMKVFKETSAYRLVYDGRDFIFQDPPAAIFDVDKLTWLETNVSSQGKLATVKIAKITTESEHGKSGISNIQAKCEEGSNTQITDFMDKFMDACLTQSQLKFTQFYSYPHSGKKSVASEQETELALGFKQALQTAFFQAPMAVAKSAQEKDIEIRTFDLTVKNHKFDLNTSISGLPRITGSGTTEYLLDAKMVKVKVDWAKAGGVNITNQFFTEIEKMQNLRLRVERPYIYIDIQR